MNFFRHAPDTLQLDTVEIIKTQRVGGVKNPPIDTIDELFTVLLSLLFV